MPSLTQWGTYSMENLGPMTTTFTAAPSCATPAQPFVLIGDDTFSRGGSPDCPDEGQERYTEGCWPSAREANSLEKAATEGKSLTQRPDDLLAYFSPGPECPGGWTTAGTIAKPTASEPLDASGVYTGRNYSIANERERYLRPDQALALALEPGETLAMCCPSGYQGEADLSYCRSSMGIASEMGFSTLCWLQGSGPDYPVLWTTFRADITKQLNQDQEATAYSIVEAVTLVYGPSDSAGGSPTATGTATPLATPTATTPTTGASDSGAGSTETPSAGTPGVVGQGAPLLLVRGLVAALAVSGLVI